MIAMIDYEKLKTANTLAHKLSIATGVRVDICIVYMDCDEPDFMLCDYRTDRPLYICSIDELIDELYELTQPEPKYKVGSTWWYLNDTWNEPDSLLINETNKDWYRKDGEWYPTKAALIEAQIAYWQSLRKSQEEYCEQSGVKLGKREGCEHESDGNMLLSCPGQWKCKKCGEFCR